jgi:hypothetical protein
MEQTPDYEGLCAELDALNVITNMGDRKEPAVRRAAQAIRTLLEEKAGLVEAATAALAYAEHMKSSFGVEPSHMPLLARALTRGGTDE